MANSDGMYEYPVGMIGLTLEGPDLHPAYGSGSPAPGLFAVTATYLVASSTAVLALLLLARLRWVRTPLAVIGGITALYYLFAIAYLLGNGFERYMTLAYIGGLLWVSATILSLLPTTRRVLDGA